MRKTESAENTCYKEWKTNSKWGECEKGHQKGWLQGWVVARKGSRVAGWLREGRMVARKEGCVERRWCGRVVARKGGRKNGEGLHRRLRL